jgi:hypothetical protein
VIEVGRETSTKKHSTQIAQYEIASPHQYKWKTAVSVFKQNKFCQRARAPEVLLRGNMKNKSWGEQLCRASSLLRLTINWTCGKV